MNRQALEKPFPSDVIKTRKGAHGQVSYVEAAHYIRRLNDAFDGLWNWSILSKEVRDGEVIVVGALEADGRVKHAFGGSRITSKTGTGETVSLADDFKAAATDALKKACSLLGVGLDLYLGDQTLSQTGPTQQLRKPSLRDVSQEAQVPLRLTAKQLKAIYAIAAGQGISDPELKQLTKEAFGVAPEYLSKADASAFIDRLSGR